MNDDNEEISRRVEVMTSTGMTCNWISMILRQGVFLTGVLLYLSELRRPHTRGEHGRKVLEALGCLAVGILPLWTRPVMSPAQLHALDISPYKFTAGVTLFSTLLLGASMCFLLEHPPFLVLALLVNSFLVNEIKWSEAYFASNWLPEDKYYDVSDKSKNMAVFVTLVSSGLAALFKTPWFYLILLVAVVVLSYILAFKTEHFLEGEIKYRQMLENNEGYMPLEWNDDRAYDFYKVNMRETSWTGWGVWFFFQYL